MCVCVCVGVSSGLIELEYLPYYEKSLLADVALEHHLGDPGRGFLEGAACVCECM